MMDSQTIGQWIAIGIVVAFIALEKAKKLFSNNPKGHGERIATLEQAVKDIREDIREIKRKQNKK